MSEDKIFVGTCFECHKVIYIESGGTYTIGENRMLYHDKCFEKSEAKKDEGKV